MISLLILTTPNRYGFSIALDYLVRTRWPETDDSPQGPDSSAD
jgi:hypothetical protein